MTTQNFPSQNGNVYRSGAQGAAVGSGSSSQAGGSTTSNRPPTGTTWVIRKAGITKPKGK